MNIRKFYHPDKIWAARRLIVFNIISCVKCAFIHNIYVLISISSILEHDVHNFIILYSFFFSPQIGRNNKPVYVANVSGIKNAVFAIRLHNAALYSGGEEVI